MTYKNYKEILEGYLEYVNTNDNKFARNPYLYDNAEFYLKADEYNEEYNYKDLEKFMKNFAVEYMVASDFYEDEYLDRNDIKEILNINQEVPF